MDVETFFEGTKLKRERSLERLPNRKDPLTDQAWLRVINTMLIVPKIVSDHERMELTLRQIVEECQFQREHSPLARKLLKFISDKLKP